MAQPISLNLPARDPRAELQLRLQNAPREHAEALLSAYEVLQGLHDRGVFELVRGALGSSDKVLEIIVDAAKEPESIRGLRNLIILSKTFGSIEPEVLEGFARVAGGDFAHSKAGFENAGFLGDIQKIHEQKFPTRFVPRRLPDRCIRMELAAERLGA